MEENPWFINFESVRKKDNIFALEVDLKQLSERKKEHHFNFTLFPEPFIGNPNAPIYLLNLNPAIDELIDLEDPCEIFPLKERLKEHIICNSVFYKGNISELNCEALQSFPFYHLDPHYKYFQGFWWWYKKLKKLVEEIRNSGKSVFESLEMVSNSIFNVEFLPYHSRYYVEIGCELPSQQFNFKLVRNALNEGKIIVVMKGKDRWFKTIPELKTSNNVFTLKSARNSVISPNNLTSPSSKENENHETIFHHIVERIRNTT